MPVALMTPSVPAVTVCVPPTARANCMDSEPGRNGAALVRKTYSLEMFCPTVVTQLARAMEFVVPALQDVSATVPDK